MLMPQTCTQSHTDSGGYHANLYIGKGWGFSVVLKDTSTHGHCIVVCTATTQCYFKQIHDVCTVHTCLETECWGIGFQVKIMSILDMLCIWSNVAWSCKNNSEENNIHLHNCSDIAKTLVGEIEVGHESWWSNMSVNMSDRETALIPLRSAQGSATAGVKGWRVCTSQH